jgi:RNA polymerase sigma-B factor
MPAQTPPSTSRMREDLVLLERYRRSRDCAARTALFDRFMPLASTLIRRRTAGPRSPAELTEIAALGLIKAVDRFDAASGRHFEPYAVRMMEGELERDAYHGALRIRPPRELVERAARVAAAIRRLSDQNGRAPTVRELVAHLDGLDEDDVLEALQARRAATIASFEQTRTSSDDTLEDNPDAAAGIECVDDRMLLCGLLRTLGAGERAIVRLRVVDEMSPDEIAAFVGLSTAHVARILRRAVARMHDVARTQEVAALATSGIPRAL